MARSCIFCGGSLEWTEIIGSVARPIGSVYQCEDCGSELTDRDLADARGGAA